MFLKGGQEAEQGDGEDKEENGEEDEEEEEEDDDDDNEEEEEEKQKANLKEKHDAQKQKGEEYGVSRGIDFKGVSAGICHIACRASLLSMFML